MRKRLIFNRQPSKGPPPPIENVITRLRQYTTKILYPKKIPSDVLSSTEESANKLTCTKKSNIFQNCNSMLRQISIEEDWARDGLISKIHFYSVYFCVINWSFCTNLPWPSHTFLLLTSILCHFMIVKPPENYKQLTII